jgi:hypothetical protein
LGQQLQPQLLVLEPVLHHARHLRGVAVQGGVVDGALVAVTVVAGVVATAVMRAEVVGEALREHDLGRALGVNAEYPKRLARRTRPRPPLLLTSDDCIPRVALPVVVVVAVVAVVTVVAAA